MDFRVEDEIIQKVVKHVYGPCLMCDRETEYGKRIPPLGMVWLRKQFEPDTRQRYVRAVRIGVAPKSRSLALLEALLCADCSAGLLKVRWSATGEREAELRQRAERSYRYHAKMGRIPELRQLT